MATGTPTASTPRRARSSASSPQSSAPGSQDPGLSPQLIFPGDRPAEIVRFESDMVALFADAATLLGVPKSVAAVYGILFASPEPLSFSEISARLNFSNGSVSQALKALREIGAIRAAAQRSQLPAPSSQLASSRASFEPDTEMRRLIQRFLEQRLETQLTRGKTRLNALQGAVSAFAPSDRKVMEQRLKKLCRWHDRTRAMMPVIRTFLNLSGK